MLILLTWTLECQCSTVYAVLQHSKAIATMREQCSELQSVSNNLPDSRNADHKRYQAVHAKRIFQHRQACRHEPTHLCDMMNGVCQSRPTIVAWLDCRCTHHSCIRSEHSCTPCADCAAQQVKTGPGPSHVLSGQ